MKIEQDLKSRDMSSNNNLNKKTIFFFLLLALLLVFIFVFGKKDNVKLKSSKNLDQPKVIKKNINIKTSSVKVHESEKEIKSNLKRLRVKKNVNDRSNTDISLPQSCHNDTSVLNNLEWQEIQTRSKDKDFWSEIISSDCMKDFSIKFKDILEVSIEFCKLSGQNTIESTYDECKYALRDLKSLGIYTETKDKALNKLSFDELSSRVSLMFSSARMIAQDEKKLMDYFYNQYGDREQVKMAYRQYYGIIFEDDAYKPSQEEKERLRKIENELGLPTLEDKPFIKWENDLNFTPD